MSSLVKSVCIIFTVLPIVHSALETTVIFSMNRCPNSPLISIPLILPEYYLNRTDT